MAREQKRHPLSERDLDLFLFGESSEHRIKTLALWKDQGKTISDQFLRGLMTLPISQAEIIGAIEICSTETKAEFELWVMNHLLAWEQNVAAVAIRAWSRITDGVLWHRLIPIASIPGLPQRVRFTILDIAPETHGFELTKATLESPEWEDLSPTFHALLIERSLQYGLSSDRLTKLAWAITRDSTRSSNPDQKALVHAMAWLMRHDTKSLEHWTEDAPFTLWTEMAKAAIQAHTTRAAVLSRIQKSTTKIHDNKKLAEKLPAVWSRHETPEPVYESLLRSAPADHHWVAGISRDSLMKTAESGQTHQAWARILIGSLPWKAGFWPARDENDFFAMSYQPEKYPNLERARSLAQQRKLGMATDCVTQSSDFSTPVNSSENSQNHPIETMFAAFRNEKTGESLHGFWFQLAQAWLSPEQSDLNALSLAARKHKGLATMAHIKILSRFAGRDDAVLKLLDYIRSDDETQLRAVVKALGEINSKRSLLELISMLTRPNASVAVRHDIVAILANKDLGSLQKELRSAVQDMIMPVNTEHPLYQIRDELSALLVPMEGRELREVSQKSKPHQQTSETDLDRELGGMIPHYRDLSSEVKRALRTALFFNQTITGSSHLNEIDLSPLIDMQYKAMELLYREFFEEPVSHSLQKGVIQRKLDVIGYARPIVRQMDDFEDYIAGLPVVKDIPFFSKFKLRKMLRAICQFEPGRRFTLDGLKAFGLYFLVFGRQNCKAGLAGTFTVGASDDRELADLCRELHVFQDFRNRAAHEGFHPDASNDIMGIWRTTASVVQWAFKIKNAQKSATTVPSIPKNAS